MCLAQQEEVDGEDEGGVEEVDGEGQEVKEKTKPPESKLDNRLQVSDIIFGCFLSPFTLHGFTSPNDAIQNL